MATTRLTRAGPARCRPADVTPEPWRRDGATLLGGGRLGVLELRQGPDGLLGRAGEDELATFVLDLADGDGDVVLAEARESTRADDDVRDGRLVGADDDV